VKSDRNQGKLNLFDLFGAQKKIIKREKEDFKQHRRWVKLRSSALALSVLCENRPQNFMENHEFSH
jgi:hypothetical protein